MKQLLRKLLGNHWLRFFMAITVAVANAAMMVFYPGAGLVVVSSLVSVIALELLISISTGRDPFSWLKEWLE